MKTKIFVMTIAILIISVEVVTAHAGTNEWTTFHFSETRSGFSPSLAPNNPVLHWSTNVLSTIQSSPAVADGKVFFGCDDGKIYALDVNTGSILWSNSSAGLVRSSPTFAILDGETSGRVFVMSGDQYVYCFNSTNGNRIWRYGPTGFASRTRSSPLVVNGYVYIANDGGAAGYMLLLRLNATTGTASLSYNQPMHNDGLNVHSSPAYYAGRLVVGLTNQVWCYDATDLSSKWSFATGGHVYSTPAYYNGKVYFGSADNKTYCLDFLLGTQLWNHTTGSVFASPAVANDTVYIASDGAPYCVYALNSTSGALIWYHNMSYAVKSSPAIADSKVFVGTSDGRMLALNISTGEEVWNFDTGSLGEIWSSPAIADGVIYFGSNDQNFYAIKDSITIYDPIRDPTGDVNAWTDIHVLANVTASQGVDSVIISYLTNRTASWQNTTMSLVDVGKGTYGGTIPGQEAQTLITYKIIAYDLFGNYTEKDGGSAWCTINVVPELSFALTTILLFAASIIAILSRKRLSEK